MTKRKLTFKTRQTVTDVSRSIRVMKSEAEISPDGLRKHGHILIQFLFTQLITGSIVLAWFFGTLLDVDTAVLTVIPSPTVAFVVIDQILTCSIILAGILPFQFTLININLTVIAVEAGTCTVAGVLVHAITTLTAVQTRCRGAVVDVDLTLVACIAGYTRTGIVVDSVNAGGSVLAQSCQALVNVVFALGS